MSNRLVRQPACHLRAGAVEIAMHFLGDYKSATLLNPEGTEKKLEIYQAEDGAGVDIDKVSVCATIKLEQ